MRALRKKTLDELEIDIEILAAYVDNVEYNKTLSSEERHELCDEVLRLQSLYKHVTGHYYTPPKANDR
jgi:hypothetical protein